MPDVIVCTCDVSVCTCDVCVHVLWSTACERVQVYVCVWAVVYSMWEMQVYVCVWAVVYSMWEMQVYVCELWSTTCKKMQVYVCELWSTTCEKMQVYVCMCVLWSTTLKQALYVFGSETNLSWAYSHHWNSGSEIWLLIYWIISIL